MIRPSFFHKEDISKWAKLVGSPYSKNTDVDKKIWIQQHLSEKLRYWGNSLLDNLPGWFKHGKTDFLDRNRKKFREYLWLRILHPDYNPDLFFTISIDIDANNGLPGLVIKLDFQRSGTNKLNFLQRDFLSNSLVRENGGVAWFGIEDIENYNWEKLLSVTINFIKQYFNLYTVLSNKLEFLKGEYRLSRLCWNSEGWTKPSGINGKSKNVDTHEWENGFGHEEWIFDTSKMIDGYHYAFLEPIHKESDSVVGKKFNIGFYSIDSNTHIRYWMGFIKDIEVISKDESDKIKNIYRDNGWLEEMINQIKSVNGKYDQLDSWTDGQLFNIRFQPENMSIGEYNPLPDYHILYKPTRYTFINNELYLRSVFNNATPKEFTSRKGEPQGSEESSKYYREPKLVQITKKHLQLQRSLLSYLRKKHGEDYVTWEFEIGNGTQVDIAVQETDRLVFYEIKTYPSIRISIREAIGQLLEYANWQLSLKKIDLVIITDLPLTMDAKRYLEAIRNKYNLPISYGYFNTKENSLIAYKFE